MPSVPPWILALRDATQVISVAGFAFLLLGLIGGSFSPRLKELRRVLVILGAVLLGACFLAGGVAAVIAYQAASQYNGGGL